MSRSIGFSRWAAGILLAVCAGCGSSSRLSRVERAERQLPLYRQAIAAEQAGNLDEAIRLLQKTLVEDPRCYSAHFQLATLLQDHAKDYIGAIHHYRTYLALRPESQKAGGRAGANPKVHSLIRERIRKAKESLAPQLLIELGDSVKEISQARLMKENERLENQLKTVTLEKDGLARERDEITGKLKKAQSDMALLHRILEKIRAGSMASAPEPVLAREKPQAEPPTAKKDIEKQRASLKKLREEAEALSAASPKPEPIRKPEPIAAGKPAARIRADLWADMRAIATEPHPADPTRPNPAQAAARDTKEHETILREDARETLNALLGRSRGQEKKEPKPAEMRVYVVQPGDTLFRVAEKFYGDPMQWKRIRNANRTRIDPDGRVRAGQSILIP